MKFFNTQKEKEYMIPLDEKENLIEKYGFVKKDPIDEGNCFSNFFIHWAYKIIRLSKMVTIKPEHLGKLSYERSSKKYLQDIYYNWENRKMKNSSFCPLLYTSIMTNIKKMILITICTILYTILNIVSIYYFRIFIKIFADKKNIGDWKNKNDLAVPFIYLAIRLLNYILQRKNTQMLNDVGYKSRVEMHNLIYDKLLKLSTSVEVKTGDIFNYIQNDSHKIYKLMSNFHNLISVPILIVMYNYLLFKFMGISFVIGFIVMIIFFIINYHYRKKFSEYLSLYLKKLDNRMKVTTEIFNNIKAIKLYGWDDIFLEKIQAERIEELSALDKRYYITTISQTLTWLAPIAMSVCSIGLYQYINKRFEVADIFACLAIFASIQGPMKNLPTSFDIVLETLASMKRIEYFLRLPEIQNSKIIRNDSETKNRGIDIQIINGTFNWGNSISSSMAGKKKEVDKSAKIDKIPKSKIKNNYIKLADNSNNEKSKNKNLNKTNSLLGNESEDKYLTNDKNKKRELIHIDNNSKNNNILEISPSNLDSEKSEEAKIYLDNINLTIKRGQLVCIIGEVGSGKSSLIQAMLNNMISDNSSKIIINGNISYVAQESWIQNNTVKNNILFYRPYEQEKYEKILELCELYQDINTFPGLDETEIGEKGINLSGGQKARISLARAMYSDGDIYILDDPLSALDAHVGKKIMNNCILGYLKRKTRILITHALQYISTADKILYIEKGKIAWEGKYNELIKQQFYSEFEKTNSNKNEEINKNKIKENDKDNKKNNQSDDKKKGIVHRLTKDETKETGNINAKIYLSYFSYVGGIKFCLGVLFILIAWQGSRILSDLWLGYWSEHQGEKSNAFFFLIYAAIATSGSLFNYIRTRIITLGSVKCSKRLHYEMITSLMNAPINLFHDITPKGQIINRLSRDLPAIDTYSMYWFMMSTAYGSSFLGAILVCSFFEKLCLIFLPFFLILSWHLYRFYINCSRELHRMEGVLNSPILNIVNETIPGINTIRAYNMQGKYIEKFQEKVDEHYKIFFYINGIDQWYTLYLNFFSILFLIYMVFTILLNKDFFTPKIIGIMLTYSVILQEDIIEFLTCFSNFENTMTKMERCLSYTKIKSENPKVLKSDLYLGKWPTKGEIKFEDFYVKYRNDTELILKNITFDLKGGEHLGIVGRTGSGKSTITLCLFRILEASSGKIYIDGKDISKIGLKKLRESITIIPQDPTLMDGTLRYNIDPKQIYTDDQIINTMEKIGFDYILKQHEEGLLYKISENGKKISTGEKQLICITRAILRNSKIIVLDEATASIDYKHEKIIQKALNEILVNSTMIIIAHRIKTVMKANKILVLDNGEVKEFNEPDKLLSDKNSAFYELYTKSI